MDDPLRAPRVFRSPLAKPVPDLAERALPRFDAARPRLVDWFAREARALPWRPPHPLALPAQDDALSKGLKEGLAEGPDTPNAPNAPDTLNVAAVPKRVKPLRSPYAVWISEIMLQQTQVATVVPYFERWMALFPTPAALADAPEDAVLRAWAGLGYYARARNLQKAARALRDAGTYPASGAGWKALPGIGDYTAGAIASLALGLREPLLDGNVARVFSRLVGLEFLPTDDASARAAYWGLAQAWVEGAEDGRVGEANEALMELGARVCVPASPRCGECPVRPSCAAAERGWQDRLPPARARAKVEVVPAVAVLAFARASESAARRGMTTAPRGMPTARVLVERRAAGFLAGHELFPLFLGAEAEDKAGEGEEGWRAAFARRFPHLRVTDAVRAGAVRHAIMSKRYDVSVWSCAVTDRKAGGGDPGEGVGAGAAAAAWLPVEETEERLTSGLAKKIWKARGANA